MANTTHECLILKSYVDLKCRARFVGPPVTVYRYYLTVKAARVFYHGLSGHSLTNSTNFPITTLSILPYKISN